MKIEPFSIPFALIKLFSLRLMLVLFVCCQVSTHAQPTLTSSEQQLMKNETETLVRNYNSMLNNLGSANNSIDEKKLFIETMVNEYFFNADVRVCNDLYTGGVDDYPVRNYLGTIMSTFPPGKGGVQFKHEVKSTKGPYQGEEGFAFYLLRVDRHLKGVNNNGIREDASMQLDFYLRFEYTGGQWSYTPKIYDIRKAEPGVEGRFSSYGSPATQVEKPKPEKEQWDGVAEKSGVEASASGNASLPAPIQKLIDDMVEIEGGTFMMGCSPGDDKCYDDESPRHEVSINTFLMGKYEVTQAQWRAVMGASASLSNPSHNKGCDQCPVEKVSWNDIVNDFLPKLNRRTGKNFRLPTEAEWEYAARGGTTTRFHTGNCLSTKQANFNGKNIPISDCRKGTYRKKTLPVGRFSPNGFGLYDMHGNVWEWCSDWYGGDYYENSPRNNPNGPSTGSKRVLHGGSWSSVAAGCRASIRSANAPDRRHDSFGFRLSLQ